MQSSAIEWGSRRRDGLMSKIVQKIWYGSHFLKPLLIPFSWLYGAIASIRRWFLTTFFQQKFSVPIVVVGNLTVGGVGKTPLVIELAKKLKKRGLQVGVVSRGYGAQIKTFPYEVKPSDSAWLVGDEPLLIAEKTGCPVVIAPKRVSAVQYLLAHYQPQVIISDDGLQHYRMGRAIEIIVIDATRGFGNGFCLPAGPLREGVSRLKRADFIVANGANWGSAHTMTLRPGKITQLLSGRVVEPHFFMDKVAAVAAIGNPQRFYSTLSELGIKFTPYYFPDHHRFTPGDFSDRESLVIMTEKDAVKCRALGTDAMYFLPVDAVLSETFWEALWSHQHLKGYLS